MGFDRQLHALRDLGKIVTGKTPKTAIESYFNGVTPFVTPTDFDGRRWIDKTLRTLTSSGIATVRSSLIPAQSVMVTCIGSDMGKVAMSAVASVTNQQINTLVVSSNHDARYIYYNLLGRRTELRALAAGSAQPILNKSSFGMIEMELPARSEQAAVADTLSALDDRIDLLRQTNTTLEAIAQALFKSWFVDFDPVHAKAEGREPEAMDAATAALFPSEFKESEQGLIPKGWKSLAFGDAAYLSKGSVNPLATPNVEFDHYSLPAFDAGQLPVCEAGGEIKSNKTPVPPGAVLVSKLNPHIPRIWPVGATGANAVCSTEFLVWVPKAPASSVFVYCLASSQPFNSAMRQLVTGTSNSHQRVKPDQLNGLCVCTASDAALEAFASMASPLLQRILDNQQQSATLTQLRDTLLPRLISGKLRLPETESPAKHAKV